MTCGRETANDLWSLSGNEGAILMDRARVVSDQTKSLDKTLVGYEKEGSKPTLKLFSLPDRLSKLA